MPLIICMTDTSFSARALCAELVRGSGEAAGFSGADEVDAAQRDVGFVAASFVALAALRSTRKRSDAGRVRQELQTSNTVAKRPGGRKTVAGEGSKGESLTNPGRPGSLRGSPPVRAYQPAAGNSRSACSSPDGGLRSSRSAYYYCLSGFGCS